MSNNLSLSERPNLATERLFLRRPNDDDIDAIVSIVGDWEIAHRLARVPHPYGIADAAFFLERVVPCEWVWAVTFRGSDELVGAVGLTPVSDANSADLGYWLSRSHWGRGIMTEAAGAVVSYGFNALAFPCITSSYFEGNRASGRVLEKLGFVEIGRATQACLAAERDVPSVDMHMLRADAPSPGAPRSDDM